MRSISRAVVVRSPIPHVKLKRDAGPGENGESEAQRLGNCETNVKCRFESVRGSPEKRPRSPACLPPSAKVRAGEEIWAETGCLGWRIV